MYPLIHNENLVVNTQVLTTVLVAGVMFFPSIGVLLTRLITKEGLIGAICQGIKGFQLLEFW